MREVINLDEIRDIENVYYIEQEIKVQIKGSTSIYNFTIEREGGGNISDIFELHNTICYDSEDVLIKEIFNNGNCMYYFDQELYSANKDEQNSTIIHKEDLDIYHFGDDDLDYLKDIGNEKTIKLLWKIIENRVYFEDEY